MPDNQTLDRELLKNLIEQVEHLAGGLSRVGGDYPHPRDQILLLFDQAVQKAVETEQAMMIEKATFAYNKTCHILSEENESVIFRNILKDTLTTN